MPATSSIQLYRDGGTESVSGMWLVLQSEKDICTSRGQGRKPGLAIVQEVAPAEKGVP